eukprot:m.187886 g.187886  ORF g.187886 m.187886 type:complete len:87 (-) comp17528_c3_seq3:4165-4425(-)
MHHLVRNLYKRFVYAGRDYPVPWPDVRRQIKEGFYKNKDLKTEDEIAHAVQRGRWSIKNIMQPIDHVKKYRMLKQRYANLSSESEQ